jgi:Fe-S cluster assembly scaffold protein SufB
MGLESWLEKIRERAKSALTKPAAYGADIDISEYLKPATGEPRLDTERTSEVGVDFSARAYYTQVDQAYFRYLSKIPGIEVKRIEDFIEENPDEAREYAWKLIDPATDKYTAIAALRGLGGYFIRVKENTRVEDPVMTCLFMSLGGLQAPHNIAIAEKGSDVTIYTGCTIAPESLGLHIGITEYYVEEEATLRYVMVHSWNRVSHVRPRTAVRVKPGGKYVSYYVNIGRVKTLQASPVVYLENNASAYAASILLGLEDSILDVGGVAYLLGDNATAELVSRAIGRDSSKITTRARIVGRSGKGHIDCRGLLLSEKSSIETIPELLAETPYTTLTHEASIGRIAEDEINYLISRGFTREEAIGIIIRGFISLDIKGLPSRVKKHIETVEKITAERSL